MQKLGILPCSNIHRWKSLGNTFQNQYSHCAKTSWNYEILELNAKFVFAKLGILPRYNEHRWQGLGKTFQNQ